MEAQLAALKPEDAIRALFARSENLTPSFRWQDIYAEEHATAGTVARSAGFDILGDIFKGLLTALSEGRTGRDFARELTPLLQAKGWWGRQLVEDPASGELVLSQLGSLRRLQLIFDVNMRVSYAAGHWSHFERGKAGRPWLRYVAILDERTRPEHRARHNLCLRVDDPYWDIWAPPCGWNCRCTLQSLSDRDVERMGDVLFFKPPANDNVPWTNKVTGEIRMIPRGIDPGWDHNPGKLGARAAANRALAEKAAGAPLQMVSALISERISSGALADFVRDPRGAMPVMPISPEIARAVGAQVSVALLSDETMLKQKRHHPELTVDDYLLLPEIALDPTVVIQDGDTSVVIVKVGQDRWRHVALKATRTGKAAFVTSYRYTSADVFERTLRKKGVRIILDKRERA